MVNSIGCRAAGAVSSIDCPTSRASFLKTFLFSILCYNFLFIFFIFLFLTWNRIFSLTSFISDNVEFKHIQGMPPELVLYNNQEQLVFIFFFIILILNHCLILIFNFHDLKKKICRNEKRDY